MIVDTGLKVLAKEFGIPQPIGLTGMEMSGLSEEHGTLKTVGQVPDEISLLNRAIH